MNKEKIKLFIFYNNDFKFLRDIFLSSIKDDYKIGCYLNDISEDKSKSQDENRLLKWQKASTFKITQTIEEIKNNMGNIIIYSDIDIVFLKPTRKIVLESIKDKDIVFQVESEPFSRILNGKANMNTGFVAIRCSEKTLGFYEDVLKVHLEDRKKVDQAIITDFLSRGTKDIKWGVFDKCISARSHSEKIIKPFMALFHANCTLDPKEKIAMINEVREYSKLSLLGKIKFYTAREINKKIKRILKS